MGAWVGAEGREEVKRRRKSMEGWGRVDGMYPEKNAEKKVKKADPFISL